MPENLYEVHFDLAEIFMKKRKLLADNSRKVRTFCGLYLGKFPIFMNISPNSKQNSENFLQDNPRKIKTFHNYNGETNSFQHTMGSQNLTF
jgi:hypothetical protein